MELVSRRAARSRFISLVWQTGLILSALLTWAVSWEGNHDRYDRFRQIDVLQHGEWYEGDAGTLTFIPEADFLSGHPGTRAFAWKAMEPTLPAPAARSFWLDIPRERMSSALAMWFRVRVTPLVSVGGQTRSDCLYLVGFRDR